LLLQCKGQRCKEEIAAPANVLHIQGSDGSMAVTLATKMAGDEVALAI
jgi:hypothetical protein